MTLNARLNYCLQQLRLTSEGGQTLVEYGLLVTLLAMAVVLILGVLGGDVVDLFTSFSTRLQDATPT